MPRSSQSKVDSRLMRMLRYILITFILFNELHASTNRAVLIESETFSRKTFHAFPKTFSFGAATAAYQIEGGFNLDGKGPSIWDTMTHNHPEMIADHSTADIGPDSYHFYKKDVEALKLVGVNNINCYRNALF